MSCIWVNEFEIKKKTFIQKNRSNISLLVSAVEKISSVKTTIIESNDCNRDCDKNMSDVSTGYTQITTGKNSV